MKTQAAIFTLVSVDRSFGADSKTDPKTKPTLGLESMLGKQITRTLQFATNEADATGRWLASGISEGQFAPTETDTKFCGEFEK